MPVDRTLAEGLTQTLADLYSAASARIAADMARQLKEGIDSPDWAADKLGSMNDLRNAIAQLIAKLDEDTTGEVEQAIVLAFQRGAQAALDELAKAGHLTAEQVTAIRHSLHGAEALNTLVLSLVSTLRGTHVRILRWALDTYRQVIAETIATGVLMGTEPRLATAQRAWDRLVSQGITGFVDKSGRRWELTSYVEMAVRTGTAQAAVQGHLDRLGARGIDLVIVSNAPQECIRCRPWEGKILDRNGAGGPRTVELEHATHDGEMVTVHVAGSVIEAVAAGLMHPNCRHSLSAYLPGITVAPTNTEDPEGDQARQQLRALERNVRKEKLAALTAFDPHAKREHEAKVRALQGDIRAHLADNPGLLRQRHREQIGAGNLPPAAGRARPHHPDKPTPEPTPPAPEPAPAEKPATHRTKDYSTLTDDELEAALNAAAETGDDTALDAVLAQMDRRQANADAAARAKAEDQALADADAAAARAAAAEAPPVDAALDPAQAAQWQRFEELLAAGETEETAAEQVFGRGIEAQRRDRAIERLRAQGYSGKGFDDLTRKAYRDYVYERYIDAEAATNGHMVTKAGLSQKVPVSALDLFTGPEARARKWASPELKEWWDINGRVTYDQWVARLLGGNTGFGGTTGDSFLQ